MNCLGLVSSNFQNILEDVSCQIIFSVSIPRLAFIVGLFLSSFLSDKFGRRKILIVGSLLQILTCCLFYFCNSFPTLTLVVAASMLSGNMAIVPSYSLLSEVSQTPVHLPIMKLNPRSA